jgi:hypothetical protein
MNFTALYNRNVEYSFDLDCWAYYSDVLWSARQEPFIRGIYKNDFVLNILHKEQNGKYDNNNAVWYYDNGNTVLCLALSLPHCQQTQTSKIKLHT